MRVHGFVSEKTVWPAYFKLGKDKSELEGLFLIKLLIT
jgi:hypothetical protein